MDCGYFAIEAVPVRESGLRDAGDIEIFRAAREAGVVVLTKDADFPYMLSQHGPPPRVLWLTCGNTSNSRLREILRHALPEALLLVSPSCRYPGQQASGADAVPLILQSAAHSRVSQANSESLSLSQKPLSVNLARELTSSRQAPKTALIKAGKIPTLPPLYRGGQDLARLFDNVLQGVSTRSVAKIVACSPSNLYDWIKRHPLTVRSPRKPSWVTLTRFSVRGYADPRNAWILMRKKGRLIKELMQDYGISKATFYRYLKEAPIPVDAQSTSAA